MCFIYLGAINSECDGLPSALFKWKMRNYVIQYEKDVVLPFLMTAQRILKESDKRWEEAKIECGGKEPSNFPKKICELDEEIANNPFILKGILLLLLLRLSLFLLLLLFIITIFIIIISNINIIYIYIIHIIKIS